MCAHARVLLAPSPLHTQFKALVDEAAAAHEVQPSHAPLHHSLCCLRTAVTKLPHRLDTLLHLQALTKELKKSSTRCILDHCPTPCRVVCEELHPPQSHPGPLPSAEGTGNPLTAAQPARCWAGTAGPAVEQHPHSGLLQQTETSALHLTPQHPLTLPHLPTAHPPPHLHPHTPVDLPGCTQQAGGSELTGMAPQHWAARLPPANAATCRGTVPEGQTHSGQWT